MRSTKEILAESDAIGRESAKLDAEIERERLKAEVRAELEAEAAAKVPKVFRSKMTPKEKSAFMTNHGTAKYMALPWAPK